jgi:hypothetical protein
LVGETVLDPVVPYSSGRLKGPAESCGALTAGLQLEAKFDGLSHQLGHRRARSFALRRQRSMLVIVERDLQAVTHHISLHHTASLLGCKLSFWFPGTNLVARSVESA